METVIEGRNARPYEREGRVFKAYRIMADITQRELGTETGIKVSMIREYEQGRAMPSAERLLRIMTRLGIPMDALSPAVASPESPESESAC